ncbi:conserved unknown protein [Ectocarpus siliculosus]|uniref:PHD-type domain-containing protein n=1 Tax=Ectocarpus siliculosus TaxID=2880 RepID=D8LN06_ECTSI|nr:conserved unknown protein [Ectocarpus siliculosus]|eukprot:CBN76247.1 conserved unknown protein [Ectocarpus siliculosus]
MRLAALAVLEESSEDNEEPANNANGVVDANESGEETESDGPEATAARRGDDGGSDAEADGTEEEEEEDICLVCCEVRDPDRILRCSNCSGGGSGMGIYHNECLPKPLESMPAEGEWVCPRCVTKKRKHGGPGAGGSKSTAVKNKGGGKEGGSKKTAAAAAAAAASRKRKVPSREDAGGGGGGADRGGEEGGGAKKPRRAWSSSMEALLATAVKKMGAGKWKEMEEDPEFDFEGMPANALRQKWRTLSQKRRS